MVISVDAAEPFDRILHLTMIKILNKLRLKETSST